MSVTARSTIASQLYNAKEPMTLFELQAWLGHRSPQSTQFYAIKDQLCWSKTLLPLLTWRFMLAAGTR